MDLNAILNRFAFLSGLTLTEAASFTQICNDAKTEIQLKIKSNINESAESGRLEAAAAALSFYKYILHKASLQGTQSFSAGDVSIKEDIKQQLESARSIWYEAKASVCDILQDDEFCFQKVTIYD